MKLRTVAELYREAREVLREAGVDSPEWDARALLRQALRLDEASFLVRQRETIPEPVAQGALALVARRAQREPLAYILGHTEFYGLHFVCDARALVPRPETEILVERAQSACAVLEPGQLVVDVGTGTGVIGITLAALHPELTVWGTDLSRPALDLATANARYHRLNGRLPLAQGPDLQPLFEAGLVDRVAVVVSNPPYVRTEELERLQPEIRHHEPRLALDGGADGLDVYRALLASCAKLPALRAIYLEIGADQGEAVSALARQHLPYGAIQVSPDLAGLPRVVEVALPAPGLARSPQLVTEGV